MADIVGTNSLIVVLRALIIEARLLLMRLAVIDTTISIIEKFLVLCMTLNQLFFTTYIKKSFLE